MANSDKNLVITPNVNSSTEDPSIVFSGADANNTAQNITVKALPFDSGTISFEASSGQLLSVTNNNEDVIYRINDIAGIPKIQVDADGIIRLAEYGGRVLIGPGLDNEQSTLQINGDIDSISSSTGTAVIRGGLGVSGDVYARDIYSNGVQISGAGAATLQAIIYATVL
jgi:hypothetical protein